MLFLWICNLLLRSYWGRNILFGFFTLVWGFFNVSLIISPEISPFNDPQCDNPWVVVGMIIGLFVITLLCLILNNVIENYENEQAYKEWMCEEKKKSQMTVGERAIYEKLQDIYASEEKMTDREITEWVILQGMIDGTDD